MEKIILIISLVLSLTINVYADEILSNESIEITVNEDSIIPEDFDQEQDIDGDLMPDGSTVLDETFNNDPLPLENEKEIIYYDSDGKYHEDFIQGDTVYTLSADDLRTILEDTVIQIKPYEETDIQESNVQIADDFDNNMLMNIQSVQASYNQSYNNTVIFSGTFDNESCKLVVPRSVYDSLTVIDGKLVNIGNSAITGKLLYNNDDIDLSEYDTYSYILNPISGTTSNVYRYGSFNFRRHYYLSSGSYPSINYTDMYGNFFVDNVDVRYSSAHRLDYIAMLAIVLGGISVIWNNRHSQH